MRLLRFGHYLRIKPFDTATQEERTQERYRRAAWSTISNLLSKGLAMAVMLLSVNWTISYLGAERFGIWMTIASFASMLTFLDLGVGNALVNHIAENAAQDKPVELEKSISGGLGFLGLIGVAVTVLLLLLAAFLPWEAVIKVADPQLVFETRRSAMLFALLFGFYLFTSGIQRVFGGLQRAFEGHLVAAISSLLAIMALWVAAKSKADVTILLAATLGIQSLAGFPLLLLLFLRKQISIKEIKTFDRHRRKQVVACGKFISGLADWNHDRMGRRQFDYIQHIRRNIGCRVCSYPKIISIRLSTVGYGQCAAMERILGRPGKRG